MARTVPAFAGIHLDSLGVEGAVLAGAPGEGKS
jgi:hypothetical protein